MGSPTWERCRIKPAANPFHRDSNHPSPSLPTFSNWTSILHNQYFLTFTTARSKGKKGELRNFRVETEERNADISHASSVFVPGPPK